MPSGRVGRTPASRARSRPDRPSGFLGGTSHRDNVGRSPTLTHVQRAAEDRNILRRSCSRFATAHGRPSRFRSYPAAQQRHKPAVMALTKAAGDAKLEVEGRNEKAAGKVQNAVGGVKDAMRDALKK